MMLTRITRAIVFIVIASTPFAIAQVGDWIGRPRLSSRVLPPGVSEITLPANEKFVGIAGHTSRMLTTRQMKTGEQPEIYKVYDSYQGQLILIIKEWRQ